MTCLGYKTTTRIGVNVGQGLVRAGQYQASLGFSAKQTDGRMTYP